MKLKKNILFFLIINYLCFFTFSNHIDPKILKKATDIHSAVHTVDTHADTPLIFSGSDLDISKINVSGCVDLPRMEEGKKAIFIGIENGYPIGKNLSLIKKYYYASVKDLVDHTDYIIKLIGINHVGFGSDFDGGGRLSDCKNVSQIGNITIELVKRGYSKEDIRKIWGGNFMRVFNQIIKTAEKL